MTIFAILMPEPQPRVVAEIVRLYPDDFLMLSDTQYLISSTATAQGLTIKLGMGPTREGAAEITGNAVVLAISSYWGRAPVSVWDWLKAKLEAPASGA
jgi:hypothetical protein